MTWPRRPLGPGEVHAAHRTTLQPRPWTCGFSDDPAAGAPTGTRLHSLRHHYASLLIRHGESVTVVQARLGHPSARETLDTYSHLWPDSEDMTRAAVDDVLGQIPADFVWT